MKLYYTPKSHFARKNRILIDALSLEVELVDAGNVADSTPEIFANNPLMKVPTLVDGHQVIYESDHIAAYLVRKFDPTDSYQVLTNDVNQLNLRAVMNGVMTAEVELIMAERSGINTQHLKRFDKLRATVTQGMNWLENQADLFPQQPSYAGFHLICLWDHLLLYQMFQLKHPHLQQHIEKLSGFDCVVKSTPL
ncbi:glutathione S-transferase family protein [Marinicella litoralis]|uniref:Glutathione S-transferase n=1 Tax=Marinicella litoralis TaxID=644220 RepID=A0A4R6XL87_9GAMM|nr:glutathione S-transferase [Marinicella litoralis]TDR20362.1 glutathione S-transferase [Marinicella litoralis]